MNLSVYWLHGQHSEPIGGGVTLKVVIDAVICNQYKMSIHQQTIPHQLNY